MTGNGCDVADIIVMTASNPQFKLSSLTFDEIMSQANFSDLKENVECVSTILTVTHSGKHCSHMTMEFYSDWLELISKVKVKRFINDSIKRSLLIIKVINNEVVDAWLALDMYPISYEVNDDNECIVKFEALLDNRDGTRKLACNWMKKEKSNGC